MVASGSKPHPPSSSKPPKNPITETQTPNTNPNPNPSTSTIHPNPIPPSDEEFALSHASRITREELLRRRSGHCKQLSKCYKDHYWALMELVRIQCREFWWKYGVSPFKQEQQKTDRDDAVVAEATDDNNCHNTNLRCAYNNYGCKAKPMALTSFCHLHILSDSKQKLYKPCGYVINSARPVPIICQKPILRSTVPSLCTLHFQAAQKQVKRALKKAGLNLSSSSKLAPKFHVIVAEYVRQIQAKRRALRRANGNKLSIKEETAD